MYTKAAILAAIIAASCIGLALGWSQGRSTTPKPPKQVSAQVKSAATTASPSDKTAVMGFLDTRGNKITLYGNGRFGIADKKGKMLIDNASLEEVKKRSPELSGLLERAVAQDASERHHPGAGTGSPVIQMYNEGIR